MNLCEEAMVKIRPGNRVGRVQHLGCVEVYSNSTHWACLFPQHGAGRKHDRKIELVAWQRNIVRENPWEFVRGLYHSDGCRDMNPVNGQNYVRYSFCNKSEDIKKLFTDTLDQLHIHWTRANKMVISIARRNDVLLLEVMLGPKYRTEPEPWVA